MKKRFLSLILLTVAISIICSSMPAMAEDEILLSNEPSGRDYTEWITNLTEWMKYIPDDAYISNLNIPATHDSGTYSVKPWQLGGSTQDEPIQQQMYSGIRAFDIRYRYAGNNVLRLCHGEGFWECDCYDYQDPLDLKRVMMHAAYFLVNHPSETLILCITHEAGAKDEKNKEGEWGDEESAIRDAINAAQNILSPTGHYVIEKNISYAPSKYRATNNVDREVYEVADYEKNFKDSIYNLTMKDARGNLIVSESHIHSNVGWVNGLSLDDDYQNAHAKWDVVKKYLDNAQPVKLNETRLSNLGKFEWGKDPALCVSTVRLLNSKCEEDYGRPPTDQEIRDEIARVRGLKTQEEKDAFFAQHADYRDWKCYIEGHEYKDHPLEQYILASGNTPDRITGAFTSCHGANPPDPKLQSGTMNKYLAGYNFKSGYYYGLIIMDCPTLSNIGKIVETNYVEKDVKYISDICGFMGETVSQAIDRCRAAGYTLLSTNGICNVNPYSSKQNKNIVIGYKTTTEKTKAIRSVIGYYGYGAHVPDEYQEVKVEYAGFNYFTNGTGNASEYTYLAYSRQGTGDPITRLELVSSGGNVGVRWSSEIFNFNKGVIIPGSNPKRENCIQLLTSTDPQGMFLSPEEGDYIIHPVIAPTKALEIKGGAASTWEHEILQIWDTAQSTGKVFTLQKYTDTDPVSYKIFAKHSEQVLEVANGSAAAGTSIWQAKENSKHNQRWVFQYAGSGNVFISSLNIGGYVDVASGKTDDGTPAISYGFTGASNQTFKLEKITHKYSKTHAAQQPIITDYKTGEFVYGWREYYESTDGFLFAKYENGVLSDQIFDLNAWKNGEGRLGEVVKITFEDKNKTTVVYNLKGQTLPDYVFPMPVYDGESAFLEWRYYAHNKKHQTFDEAHFDNTIITDRNMTITAERDDLENLRKAQNSIYIEESMTEMSRARYVINEDVPEVSQRVTVKDWAVLIVHDGRKVTFKEGIHVPPGATLIIVPSYSSIGTGEVSADGYITRGAGIGGNRYESGGNVAVYGGKLFAFGGDGAAGIGGGLGAKQETNSEYMDIGNGGTFYIAGGEVKAYGGNGAAAAGIGGGKYGGGAKVQFDGGTVYAYGGVGNAAIGRGGNCQTDRWEEIRMGKNMRAWDIAAGDPGVLLEQVTLETLNKVQKVFITGLGGDEDKYQFIEGEKQTIFKDAVSAKFVSNADLSLFEHVEIDGETVPEKYYTVRGGDGSTVIEFNQDFIDMMSIGEYNLIIVSKDGSASTSFKVMLPLPMTGDKTNIPLMLTMLLISGGIILLLIGKIRKMNNQ